MSLKITSSEIQIQNSSGVVKFTSANKLVFPRYSKTGSVTVTTGTVLQAFDYLGEKEFLHLVIKLTACNGNVGNGLLNVEIPANGSIILNFDGRAVNNTAAADTEYLGISLAGNQLVFKSCKVDYTNNLVAPTVTTSLTYTARIYSYL
jgi:CRISPR/Cas system CMR subunit Cmr4 (Cas7 group RAMP superfamily)